MPTPTSTPSLSNLTDDQIRALAAGQTSGTTNPMSNLPTVTDPTQVYAQMTRGEYLDFVRNYGGFEDTLIAKAQSDTSLIDQARADTAMAQDVTQGVAARNAARYGANLTPAQLEQQQRQLQRSNTLGGIQSLADARIAQREANTLLMSDLINIGQGVNRASQQQLGSAAADATAKRNADRAASAAKKAATYQTVGSLGAAAIIAFAF